MPLVFEKNKSLKALNSLGFDANAQCFVQAKSDSDIEEVVRYAADNKLPLFVLGGGSNIVLVKDIAGVVMQLVSEQVSELTISRDTTHVTADAGMPWHRFVLSTLESGIAGLENLSLIPGTVGAAPIQNIGAYGVEVKSRLHCVRALHRPTLSWVNLPADECQFSYRNSLFKQRPEDYVIASATFNLGAQHPLQTSYHTLSQYLEHEAIDNPSCKDISNAVISIRRSRLPDPAFIGNAGSFFHNPMVSADKLHQLLKNYPNIPHYPQPDGNVKIAAGWLIETLGFKGLKRGGVGVHDKQALVLVNTGTGTGEELISLAEDIQQAVQDRFGIGLSIEPQVI